MITPKECICFKKDSFDSHKCHDLELNAFVIPKRGSYVFKKFGQWYLNYFFEAHIVYDVEEIYGEDCGDTFINILRLIKEKGENTGKTPEMPWTFTVPKSGIYQVTMTATTGDILCLNKYATKSVEIIKPKWWQFWKPVIEKHYIVYDGEVK